MIVLPSSRQRSIPPYGAKRISSSRGIPRSVVVTFTWGSVVGAGQYLLEIGRSVGATNVTITGTESPVTTYNYRLYPGTYYWRVRAVIGGFPGVASSEQVITVPIV